MPSKPSSKHSARKDTGFQSLNFISRVLLHLLKVATFKLSLADLVLGFVVFLITALRLSVQWHSQVFCSQFWHNQPQVMTVLVNLEDLPCLELCIHLTFHSVSCKLHTAIGLSKIISCTMDLHKPHNFENDENEKGKTSMNPTRKKLSIFR